MSYKAKGHFEVEKGFGLPRYTTANRLAYTPPSAGYKVYDTDLGAEFSWTGAAWNQIGESAVATHYIIDGTVDFTTAEPAHVSGQKYINTVTGAGSTTTGTTFINGRVYESDGAAWTETTPAHGYTYFNKADNSEAYYNSTDWIIKSTAGSLEDWQASFAYTAGTEFTAVDPNDSVTKIYQVPTGFVGNSGTTFDLTESARYTLLGEAGSDISNVTQLSAGTALTFSEALYAEDELYIVQNIDGTLASILNPIAGGALFVDGTVGATHSLAAGEVVLVNRAATNMFISTFGGGGLAKKGDVTSDADAGEGIYTLDASGGAFTFTLPAATGSQERRLILAKDVETNNVTIGVQTGESLNGITNGTSVADSNNKYLLAVDIATGSWVVNNISGADESEIATALLSLSANQGVLTTNEDIAWDINSFTGNAGGNIANASGSITLKGGFRYKLTGILGTTAANQLMQFSFHDGTAFVGLTGEASSFDSQAESDSSAYAIVEPTADTTYTLRLVTVTGSPSAKGLSSKAVIEQLPATLTVNPDTLPVEDIRTVVYAKTTGLGFGSTYSLDNSATWNDMIANYEYLEFNYEVDITGVADDVLRTITIKTSDIRDDTRWRMEYGAGVVDFEPGSLTGGDFGFTGSTTDEVALSIVGVKAQKNVVQDNVVDMSYSTTEVNTGNTWVDGKPIYRKVTDLTGGSFPLTVVTGVDSVIHKEGVVIIDDAFNVGEFVSTDASISRGSTFGGNFDELEITSSPGTLHPTNAGHVVIEYTKI